MQIDWFTFGAQIVNFLILVALLRMFLYKPIVNAMNEREQKIASRLEDAQRKQEEAAAEVEDFRSKQRELDQQRDELLAAARDQADEQRQELIEQARGDVADMRSDWQRAVQREKETFLRRLRTRVSSEVFAVARRALWDLADTELQEQLVDRFAHEIKTLDDEQCTAMLRDADQAIEVHSAFGLSDAQRERVEGIVREQFGQSTRLDFATDSDLICGLALVTGSCQIGWNIHDYLHTLHEHLEAFLAEQALSEPEEVVGRAR
ncbi:MAG: F0F1 ATP synthase subunit B [Chloroflexi bacterium]|nr:F0F1 ATP synthase subunit B [Chloroflexota bacterium]